jgi:TRAP-type uncharacterized transport system fused permease subunit
MMKKVGFSPRFSAGVEAAASTGGQLMPPIMGAGAFIMSQWTQIPYLTIVGVAFIPAIMYFLTVAFFVHLRAKKTGLGTIAEQDIPRLVDVLKEGWNFFIPIAVLIGFLMNGFTPTFAACAGIGAIVVSSWFNRHTRMGFKDILDAMALGAKNMVTTAVILLCSGIVIGVVLMVGMGIKFSMLISVIAGGSLFITIVLIALASLILGMGLPVTASYIVLAVLAAPPVCLAAYSAAGIAGSRPLPTGIEAWKLAKGLYIIPLLFVYTPLLFESTVFEVIVVAVSATMGLFAFAVFMEGFFRITLPLWERGLVGLAAFGLLWPVNYSRLTGFAVLGVLYLRQRFLLKRRL